MKYFITAILTAIATSSFWIGLARYDVDLVPFSECAEEKQIEYTDEQKIEAIKKQKELEYKAEIELANDILEREMKAIEAKKKNPPSSGFYSQPPK